MVKTLSQTGNITIKKEEEDCRSALRLDNVTMTARSKIAKSKPPTLKNRNLPARDIKVEQDINIKSVLKISKPQKGRRILQEQISQLIGAIVNDKISITKAARKVNITKDAGRYSYNTYMNDPEKKIPVLRERRNPPKRSSTQEHIGNLIRYISDDKMAIRSASAKANMSYQSGYHYYSRYLRDRNHTIPIRKESQYTYSKMHSRSNKSTH